MSADLPSFWFPPPGPALPPLPESTLELKPPEDDPRLNGTIEYVEYLHWYMYNILQNEENYLSGSFSWNESDIHMGDVIVPVSKAPERNIYGTEDDWVRGWEMWCFRCPSTVAPEEPERDPMTGYPFCGESILSMEPLRYFSTTKKEPVLEVPVSTVPGADSVMACVIEQQVDPEWFRVSSTAPELGPIITKPFIVSRSLRDSDSGTRYRYTETFPWGVLDDAQSQQATPSPTPTPTSTTDFWDWYDDYAPTSVSNPSVNPAAFTSNSKGSAPSAGIIIGVLVPVALIIGIVACFGKRSRAQQRKATAASAPPMNTNAAADARRQAAVAARASRTTAAPVTVQGDVDDMPPPAYHKVVSNVERMDIERRMHAEGTAPVGWPPTYTDARHAESTTVTQPDPVASVPGTSRAPYPALPSSPTR
ncbi:hypothetical protein GGP41_007165 [Bipolaris sorokiniana]|uniref:Uncharacterized protein n=2 Tax=Cochliobolus sativus TaxID=45130 RepID=A0A8H6E0L0_COCSA|nr:uncharacterized protein COCSADRAFT_188035 [Bipolaris sorokiniana ND90Pr]EMD67250.1 hypothetical protein COCSADRAFT_188035 [Bipolaris sorokiniana ND90Pr]KAF5854403.1 hypothetical protein GGP41_007165 [Bipolaris sorokiniana]